MKLGIFAAIVALMQIIFADPYLTDRTLVYQNGSKRGLIWRTPWWMVVIWAGALLLLGLWFVQTSARWPGLIGDVIFLVTGSLFFLVVEIAVGKYLPDMMWKRIYCQQRMHVAYYAIAAEVLTVLLLELMLPGVIEASTLSGAMGIGVFTGMLTALIFGSLCSIGYGPANAPK